MGHATFLFARKRGVNKTGFRFQTVSQKEDREKKILNTRLSLNMSTTALMSVWQTILSYNLSAANKRWLADHLYEQARKEEAQPYTIEELNARIDCAEADIAAGRIISRADASERMQNYMNKYL